MAAPPYGFFQVTGLEIEYPCVDSQLRARPLVAPAFRLLAGRPASDVTYDGAVFSNELAAHVFEIKLAEPSERLDDAAIQLRKGVAAFNRLLSEQFDGAMLLPTGMHPFLRPGEAELWSGSGARIYEAFDAFFKIRQHGWLNVQSTHINLPFGTEEQTVALYNAMMWLIPYLPALTAASPFFEGRSGPYLCNRLAFYQRNQEEIPIIAAGVVPEQATSFRQIRRDVYGAIYKELRARGEKGRRLCHEWINSRGAMIRFTRGSIELRTVDAQECVRMDVALAVWIRAVLAGMTERIQAEGLPELPRATLLADFAATIEAGDQASVKAPGVPIRGRRTARAVLEWFATLGAPYVPPREGALFDLANRRLAGGSLARAMVKRVNRRSSRTSEADAIRAVYLELAQALVLDEPWPG